MVGVLRPERLRPEGFPLLGFIIVMSDFKVVSRRIDAEWQRRGCAGKALRTDSAQHGETKNAATGSQHCALQSGR